ANEPRPIRLADRDRQKRFLDSQSGHPGIRQPKRGRVERVGADGYVRSRAPRRLRSLLRMGGHVRGQCPEREVGHLAVAVMSDRVGPFGFWHENSSEYRFRNRDWAKVQPQRRRFRITQLTTAGGSSASPPTSARRGSRLESTRQLLPVASAGSGPA